VFFFSLTCKNIYETAKTKTGKLNNFWHGLFKVDQSIYMFRTKSTLISFCLTKMFSNASKCKHWIERKKFKYAKGTLRKKVPEAVFLENFQVRSCNYNPTREFGDFLDGIILLSDNGSLKHLSLFLHHSLLQFECWLLLIKTISKRAS
jgi:hypothetical protein